jgi:serine/threonine protein kinase
MLQVDVWALGISAIEMAELTPPRWKVHPLRVIFMISREPPPGLAEPAKWSETFQDFLTQCLQKVRVWGLKCWSWVRFGMLECLSQAEPGCGGRRFTPA